MNFSFQKYRGSCDWGKKSKKGTISALVIACLDCTGKICTIPLPHRDATERLSWPVTLRRKGAEWAAVCQLPPRCFGKGASPRPPKRPLSHAALVARAAPRSLCSYSCAWSRAQPRQLVALPRWHGCATQPNGTCWAGKTSLLLQQVRLSSFVLLQQCQ